MVYAGPQMDACQSLLHRNVGRRWVVQPGGDDSRRGIQGTVMGTDGGGIITTPLLLHDGGVVPGCVNLALRLLMIP